MAAPGAWAPATAPGPQPGGGGLVQAQDLSDPASSGDSGVQQEINLNILTAPDSVQVWDWVHLLQGGWVPLLCLHERCLLSALLRSCRCRGCLHILLCKRSDLLAASRRVYVDAVLGTLSCHLHFPHFRPSMLCLPQADPVYVDAVLGTSLLSGGEPWLSLEQALASDADAGVVDTSGVPTVTAWELGADM